MFLPCKGGYWDTNGEYHRECPPIIAVFNRPTPTPTVRPAPHILPEPKPEEVKNLAALPKPRLLSEITVEEYAAIQRGMSFWWRLFDFLTVVCVNLIGSLIWIVVIGALALGIAQGTPFVGTLCRLLLLCLLGWFAWRTLAFFHRWSSKG